MGIIFGIILELFGIKKKSYKCLCLLVICLFFYYAPESQHKISFSIMVRSRTATGMDGTLTLIFRKSETSRDIIKYF
jgi:hypothetical protein